MSRAPHTYTRTHKRQLFFQLNVRVLPPCQRLPPYSQIGCVVLLVGNTYEVVDIYAPEIIIGKRIMVIKIIYVLGTLVRGVGTHFIQTVS